MIHSFSYYKVTPYSPHFSSPFCSVLPNTQTSITPFYSHSTIENHNTKMTKPLTVLTWSLMIIVTTFTLAASAQTPPPAEAEGPSPTSSDCMPLIYNMSDCLSYVEKGSNATKPEKPCCPELAKMLDIKPVCLCQLLGKTKDFPVQLDVDRALQLPALCGLKTPPLSICQAAGIPIGGPASAPTSTEGGITPEAGESSPGKNEATNAHFVLLNLLALLAIAYLHLDH
ncbi:non-specific lipid transfer protein GPI-anchored 12-like [Silene latifolia]|uniref:non-specific lipid transfer protein GPI-anchored 12-like n=1 Tax=Silene latifolia TaxID=37657 RepID=UPI003D786DDD